MKFLVIDQDRGATERLGLACLDRGVGAMFADNVCDGVRTLLREVVTLVVVDAALLRLTARESATLFDRVAPGVPVVVVARPDAPLETRVAFELAGFRVMTRPVAAEDLLEKLALSA
jgi:DNA-binding response OmpR family regulator